MNKRIAFALRIVAGLIALVPGLVTISLTLFADVNPVFSMIVWIGFLVKVAIVIIFITSERAPTGSYIETAKASEIFQAMNASLVKTSRENRRLRGILNGTLNPIKLGDDEADGGLNAGEPRAGDKFRAPK